MHVGRFTRRLSAFGVTGHPVHSSRATLCPPGQDSTLYTASETTLNNVQRDEFHAAYTQFPSTSVSTCSPFDDRHGVLVSEFTMPLALIRPSAPLVDTSTLPPTLLSAQPSSSSGLSQSKNAQRRQELVQQLQRTVVELEEQERGVPASVLGGSSALATRSNEDDHAEDVGDSGEHDVEGLQSENGYLRRQVARLQGQLEQLQQQVEVETVSHWDEPPPSYVSDVREREEGHGE